MIKNEVIDRYMHYMYYAEFYNESAQVCIYSLADLNIGHCVELTFFEGKLGGFFVVKIKKNLVMN